MLPENLFKRLLFKVWLISIALYLCTVVRVEEGDIVWQFIETKHTIIRYQSLEDLKKFDKSIKYTPGASGLKWLFSSRDSNTLKKKLKKKMDAIYERVQEILDMRKQMKRVVINCYRSSKIRKIF